MRSLQIIQNTWVDVWKLLGIEVCNYHNYHHDPSLTSAAICHKRGRKNPTCTSRDARLLGIEWKEARKIHRLGCAYSKWHPGHGQLSSICTWHRQIHQVSNTVFFVGDWPQQPNDQTTNGWYLRDAQRAKPSTSCPCRTQRLALVEGLVERQKLDLTHPIVLKKILLLRPQNLIRQ